MQKVKRYHYIEYVKLLMTIFVVEFCNILISYLIIAFIDVDDV